MVRFLIAIPEGLHSEIKATAQAHGQTVTGLIRQILWEWKEQQDRR